MKKNQTVTMSMREIVSPGYDRRASYDGRLSFEGRPSPTVSFVSNRIAQIPPFAGQLGFAQRSEVGFVCKIRILSLIALE